MKRKEEWTCEDHAKCIEIAAGWAFASIFRGYFGEGALVLASEGPDGGDLEFSVTEEWLEKNHISRFGLGEEDAMFFLNHMDHCGSPECVAAKKKYDAAMPFLRGVKVPGGDSIAFLLGQFAGVNMSCIISREKGAAEAIDEIKPLIEWFIGENRKLWVWPEDESCNEKGE